jgi:hypothetical protein
VGTTKLTRKEIMAEDPVHEALIGIVELFRMHGVTIALVAASVALLGIGIYFGTQYLDGRETQGQKQLAQGIDFYHAEIKADAQDDPYAKGITTTFRTDKARNEAASKEFSSILSMHKYCKLAVLARYYLGLTQLRLGQDEEGMQNLRAVSQNTKDPAVANLSQKVLASRDYESGNYKGAQEILQAMIQNPKCELLKEDLQMDLSRVLAAQGKRDEAIQLLSEARKQAETSLLKSKLNEELTKLQGGSKATADALNTISVKP